MIDWLYYKVQSNFIITCQGSMASAVALDLRFEAFASVRSTSISPGTIAFNETLTSAFRF